MAPTIFNLLNAQPVKRNDNLRKIAFMLGLLPPKEHTKLQIQQEIVNFLHDKPDIEQKVRVMANEMKAECKQISATKPITIDEHETPIPNTQLDLFCDEITTNSDSANNHSTNNKTANSADNIKSVESDDSAFSAKSVDNTIGTETGDSTNKTNSDTQSVENKTGDPDNTCSFMDTDQSNIEPNGHKRKHVEDETEVNEPKIRLLVNHELSMRELTDLFLREAEKRNKEMENLTNIVNEDRSLHKEQFEILNTSIHSLNETFTKYGQELTQAFKDEVTKGLEKIGSDVRIGIECVTAFVPTRINEILKASEKPDNQQPPVPEKQTTNSKNYNKLIESNNNKTNSKTIDSLTNNSKTNTSKTNTSKPNTSKPNNTKTKDTKTNNSTINNTKTNNTKTSKNNNINKPSSHDKPIVMVITDSNGKDLDRNLLKPESYVVKNRRYTVKDATATIPWVSDTEKVTDVVFQVGLNDLRKGCSPDKIQEDTLEMQMKYVKHFPNARQHITALPPLGEKHNKVNGLLQKLASYTESNFISTKEFRDKATGRLRANLMKDPSKDYGRTYHYNEWGVSILSKEIKKSLYSKANMNNQCLTAMSNMSSSTATVSTPTTPTPAPPATPVSISTPPTTALSTPVPTTESPSTPETPTDIDTTVPFQPVETSHGDTNHQNDTHANATQTNSIHTNPQTNDSSTDNVVPTSNRYESLDNL